MSVPWTFLKTRSAVCWWLTLLLIADTLNTSCELCCYPCRTILVYGLGLWPRCFYILFYCKGGDGEGWHKPFLFVPDNDVYNFVCTLEIYCNTFWLVRGVSIVNLKPVVQWGEYRVLSNVQCYLNFRRCCSRCCSHTPQEGVTRQSFTWFPLQHCFVVQCISVYKYADFGCLTDCHCKRVNVQNRYTAVTYWNCLQLNSEYQLMGPIKLFKTEIKIF